MNMLTLFQVYILYGKQYNEIFATYARTNKLFTCLHKQLFWHKAGTKKPCIKAFPQNTGLICAQNFSLGFLGCVMNSKLLSLVAGLCSACLVSPSSLAASFVFEFDMPAFDAIGNFGVTSVLQVTVDNGGSSIISQSWDSNEITALWTDITGPSFSMTDQNGVESGAITTDAAGVPTMSFLGSGQNFYRFGRDAGGLKLIQLGRDCDYAVYSGGIAAAGVGGGACSGGGTIWPLIGSVVPIPAAAWLFGSALLGLGVIKRKRV